MRSFRQFIGGIFLCLCLAGGPVQAGAPIPPDVPEARDLGLDSGRSRDLGIPILVVVTREECGYCALLKRAVIVPMILSGEYVDRVIIRELNIDGRGDVMDFGGRRVSPFAVADRYGALLTPTVLVLGPEGREVAPRLVGVNNVHMYLWYLDQAIEEGTAEITGSVVMTP